MKRAPVKPRRHRRGGQGGHEPHARIRTRESRVLELSIQGWTQRDIAAEVGIPQAAVSHILKRVEGRVLQEMSATVERQKVRMTLQLEHICREALRAWERSKGETTRRRQRKTQPGLNGTGTTVAEITVDRSHGDARYLEVARRAMADFNKLWGLDAPQKLNMATADAPFADLTEGQLEALIAQQAALLERVRSPRPTIDVPRSPSHVEE